MKEKWEQKIDQFIAEKRDEIVEQVSRLVRIESVSAEAKGIYPYGEECAKALDFCGNLAEKNGLFVENYDYYGIEIRPWERREKYEKRLLLAAHVDVVPASEGNIYPAFGGVVDKGYIIGRGVVDDKGPLLALLYALVFLREHEIVLPCDVRLFVGSHEETDMEDIKYYLEQVGQPDFGLAADDDFPITNGEKSVLKVRLKMTSESGEKEKEFLEKLIGDRDGVSFGLDICSKQYGNTVCRVKEEILEVQGNTEMVGKCVVADIRIPVCMALEDAKRKLINSLDEQTGKKVSVEIIKEDPGYYISDKEGIPKLLVELYNEISGTEDEAYAMEGCTYARHFRQGCGFGAGNPHESKPFPQGHGASHGPDEAHNIDVLMHAVKMDILGIMAIADYWKTEKETLLNNE